ncbi:protein grindelwald [Neodiprion lecontei]|uniref:Protein grindelwald n=1 Tax=Neodiprion lecontei TaxID=441921 RepID=A0A6J0CEK3_NEOLC|nr:protein grindelwald [Neodiprion lecontei]
MFYNHVAVLGLFVLCSAQSTIRPGGRMCGTMQCLPNEYCSTFDSQCQTCAKICDPTTHNHDLPKCTAHCQEYLLDQRYVLRKELLGEDPYLRAEVQRLKNLVTITLTVTCLAVLVVALLLVWKSQPIKKIRKSWQGGQLSKKWVKKPTNNNRVQDDVEVGQNPKQNGLKLAMPTISATVVAPRSEVGDGTPNTTSTPLSRRHPSEDTTLDYAYDNQGMTPSPETVQPRTKRESSF